MNDEPLKPITIDGLIERLTEIRKHSGGDVPVAVDVSIDGENTIMQLIEPVGTFDLVEVETAPNCRQRYRVRGYGENDGVRVVVLH